MLSVISTVIFTVPAAIWQQDSSAAGSVKSFDHLLRAFWKSWWMAIKARLDSPVSVIVAN